jgi:hypothetical protein
MRIAHLASKSEGNGDEDPEPRWWEWAAIFAALLIMGALDRARRYRRVGL